MASFDQTVASLAQKSEQAGAMAHAAISSGDMSNPQVWAEIHKRLGEYQNLISFQSSYVQVMKQMLSNIIQKIA